MPKKDIKWNLTHLYKSDNDPQMKIDREASRKANMKFINKWKDRKDYLEDPKVLREALDGAEELTRIYGESDKEQYYLWLRQAQEEDNTKLKALNNKVNDFARKISNESQFFSINLSKVSKEIQNRFLKSPELKKYKHFLERIFASGKYTLSDEEEKIISNMSKTSHSNWTQMISTFLSKEEAKTLQENEKVKVSSFEEIANLLSSKNQKVRDQAAKHFHNINKKHSSSAEAEINSILENHKNIMEMRGMKRPDEGRHLADDIETKIVDILKETVTENFGITQRYYKLKAQLMGKKKLSYHERNVPLGKEEVEYTFEESIKLISDVFNNLSPIFKDIVDKFNNEGSFDVFPKKGKSGGAFCIGYKTSLPVYILLNHTNKLNNVLTIAHECGHGINDVLMAKSQNELHYGTSLATAEVASTFFEDFVLEEILKTADDETKFSIIMQKLNDDVSSIYRQISCYNFETDLHNNFHKKGYLSKEEIGEIFTKNMEAYMGDSVKQDPGSENWWVYWSHIRRFFYVYSYANGLLISKSLQASVKEDPQFIKKVITFLSAGRSKSPKDIFLDMGIDITKKSFWEKGIKETENLLNEAEKLAKKLGKI